MSLPCALPSGRSLVDVPLLLLTAGNFGKAPNHYSLDGRLLVFCAPTRRRWVSRIPRPTVCHRTTGTAAGRGFLTPNWSYSFCRPCWYSHRSIVDNGLVSSHSSHARNPSPSSSIAMSEGSQLASMPSHTSIASKGSMGLHHYNLRRTYIHRHPRRRYTVYAQFEVPNTASIGPKVSYFHGGVLLHPVDGHGCLVTCDVLPILVVWTPTVRCGFSPRKYYTTVIIGLSEAIDHGVGHPAAPILP